MSEYLRVDFEGMRQICLETWKKVGYTEEQSVDITEVLLGSDLRGVESHGIQRYGMYLRHIEAGKIKVDGAISVVQETPISAVLDGGASAGQVVGRKAMRIAIEKAKKAGIGIVTVRNSTHYGIAGYYADMAAEEDLLGISMTNSQAIVVPTFGRTPMMGTNPIAVSMPAKPHIFHLDMATSVVPGGKMEVYDKLGKPLPEGWLVDTQGNITTNARDYKVQRYNMTDGGLLPLGGYGEAHSGHKGYSLAVVVELLTGIFACSCPSTGVELPGQYMMTSHMFAAIDFGLFGNREKIVANFSNYLQSLRDSKKAGSESRIYVAGDKAAENMEYVKTHGIKLSQKTYDEIKSYCIELGIDYQKLLKVVSEED